MSNASNILAIGFLSQDPACSVDTPVGPVDPVTPTTDVQQTGSFFDTGSKDEPDINKGLIAVFAICGGIILILAIVSVVVCLKHKSPENYSTSKVSTMNVNQTT